MIVLLINYFNFVTRSYKFKHGNSIIGHKLGGDRSAKQFGILLSATSNVLLGLDYSVPVGSSFSLYRHYGLTTVFVYPYIDFINFYLSYTFDRCSEVVL